MPKRVVVAMSGGVDSSVVAALLQEQGFEVLGMFMKNWSPETIQNLVDCPWEQDQADALAVCAHLGIPFRSINFEHEYKERVVDYFLQEYAAGRTPNPDVMCNKEIKFAAFLKAAKEMGADFIATGHYAQVEEVEKHFYLRRGTDPKKDQSYFLYTLIQEQLSQSLFPIGHLLKSEVRELAKKFNLPTALKKDSQGICFIGHIDLKKFLMEHITARSGLTYLLPAYDEKISLQERKRKAWVVGKHQGVMFYTLGERAGAVVDNGLYKHLRANLDVPPTYVLDKDIEGNRLYVSEQHDDPHAYAKKLVLENWWGQEGMALPYQSSHESSDWSVQVRYGDKNPAKLARLEYKNEKWFVEAQSPLWAPAPGQSAVIYDGDRVVGGGVIEEVKRDGDGD